MDWDAIYQSAEAPTPEALSAYVGSPYWDELLAFLKQAYGLSPALEYSRCPIGTGWNLKFRAGGRCAPSTPARAPSRAWWWCPAG